MREHLNAQIKLTETWKAFQGKTPNPTQSLKSTQLADARASRSATNGNLKELETSILAKITFMNDSAPLWNRAPNSIKNSTSLYSAEKEIKKFVRTLPV